MNALEENASLRAQLKGVYDKHAAEMNSVQVKHAAETNNVQVKHAPEMSSVQVKHATEMSSVQAKHATEMNNVQAKLREEHKADLRNVQAELRAEHAIELASVRESYITNLFEAQRKQTEEINQRIQEVQRTLERQIEEQRTLANRNSKLIMGMYKDTRMIYENVRERLPARHLLSNDPKVENAVKLHSVKNDRVFRKRSHERIGKTYDVGDAKSLVLEKAPEETPKEAVDEGLKRSRSNGVERESSFLKREKF